MLIEQTLFGIRDKVQTAIIRLQEFVPPEGYYLAFSGGKDSQAIYRLAEIAGVGFAAHYSPTTIDPPELLRFIRTHYPAVVWEPVERSMWAAILANHWPPTRQQRYCCREFKERAGRGRRVVTGIRWEESVARRRRHLVETCYRDGVTSFVNPIIDWTSADVWQFIRQEGLPYCSLYDEGFTRLGCVLCPMGRDPQRDIVRWPDIAARYVRCFGKVIEDRRKAGKYCSFASAEAMFTWWIQRSTHGQGPEQMLLFE